MTRRAAAGAAAVLLLALVLASQSWGELPRRARVLAAFAPKELAVRRLGGSGTAFDRRYFSFLENVRRRIPAGTAAVVVRPTAGDRDPRFYLATYSLAPLPVYIESFSDHWVLPKDWLIAAYGEDPTYGYRIFAQLPEGVLLGLAQR